MDGNIAIKPHFKRRQLIVARRFQLKYAGIILGLMFVTAGFCAYAIYYTTMILFGEKLANVYPQGQLIAIVRTVNMRILISMLVISPLIGFLGIYLSHKIAGPIYRIEKFLSSMASGDLSARITLRRGDEMVSLADSINKLTESLSQMVTTEKAHIEHVLAQLYTLREMINSSHKDKDKMNAAIESLDSEIRLLSTALERYKLKV
ncbi:MAG: methyl-accepting chemotaxis protein [Candidatus Omnitrophica bacterium]|nr:methyl-accepting chemotaxis protein [Candidatus Omnitrophota bacterium]MDD5436509.1 methyl-accepting chemotaxis protein [Candidatus Omnitrophota bacterium]